MSERGHGDREQTARDMAVANRERINVLEREVAGLRQRQHEVASEVAAVTYIAREVGKLAEQVRELASQVQTLSRRALERPTSGGISAAASWVSVLIAAAALMVVALR